MNIQIRSNCRGSIYTFMHGNFALFLFTTDIKNRVAGIPPVQITINPVQNVNHGFWIEIRYEKMLDLIWIRTVCKDYKQVTNEERERERKGETSCILN